jgi:hypothetical protein
MQMVRLPQAGFIEMVDRTLARARIGPTLTEPVKCRLRALANAADDLEKGNRKGHVFLNSDDADWLQQNQSDPNQPGNQHA